MEFVKLNRGHAEDAASLLLDAYRAERRFVPILPDSDYRELFTAQAASMADTGLGVAAIENGKLAGFLSGFPVENFFGNSRGVYIPLYGHGTQSEDKSLIYQRLYASASAAWVRDGLLSHVITVYTHDSIAVDTWFWQGFGLRCVDAIRPLAAVKAPSNGLQVRRVMPDDAELLIELHREHQRYYRNAPLFMPIKADCTAQQLREWLGAYKQYMWAAFDGETPISYMQLRHQGETFISDDEKMMNICGAFTTESVRRSGAGAQLLNCIVSWMAENSFERLGVDYESFNSYGSRFWAKRFTAFTYSLTRRIDERIVEFEG